MLIPLLLSSWASPHVSPARQDKIIQDKIRFQLSICCNYGITYLSSSPSLTLLSLVSGLPSSSSLKNRNVTLFTRKHQITTHHRQVTTVHKNSHCCCKLQICPSADLPVTSSQATIPPIPPIPTLPPVLASFLLLLLSALLSLPVLACGTAVPASFLGLLFSSGEL